MNKLLLIVLAAVLLSATLAPNTERIKWLSPEEAEAAYAKEPRPILIDLYTDWCGWCKRMDKATYENPKVVAYVNSKYYPVKYNAESRKPVQFNNRKYVFRSEYKCNEFAVYLTGGQLQYPTTVFLASPSASPAPLAGYLVPKDIEGPMKFFGGGHYLSKTYPQFMERFKGEWGK